MKQPPFNKPKTPRIQPNAAAGPLSSAVTANDGPIPFSAAKAASSRRSDSPRDPAGEVLAAFADVSRRIHHLARELKCLGYFDDDDDRPRAA